jgi:hypothetical protein
LNGNVIDGIVKSEMRMSIIRCSFISCESVKCGGAIFCSLENNGEMYLNGIEHDETVFENCSINTIHGYVGGIYLHFADDCSMESDLDYHFSTDVYLIFDLNCIAMYGKHIFIETKYLSTHDINIMIFESGHDSLKY